MSGDQLPMFELRGEKGPEIVDVPPGKLIPSRSTDPVTSHAAAREIRVKAGSQRARLLEAFASSTWLVPVDGLTDEQAMEVADFVSPFSEYSKRCSELREGGYIAPTGETRVSPSSGKARLVSRITDKGRQWIRENS